MSDVCVIGNSHAACWLAAWRRHRADLEQLARVRLFVLGGYEIDKFFISNGLLTVSDDDAKRRLAETSGGLTHIDPDSFDHFVIVSLTSGYRNLTSFFTEFGVTSGPVRHAELTYISRPCMELSLRGILRDSLAVRLRRKIGAVSDKPVLLSPSPCQSEDILRDRESLFAALCQNGEQASLYTMYKQAMSAVAEEERFDVLFQDDATMIPGGGYTRREHSRQGIDSTMNEAAPSDTSHMNVEFGLRELRNVLERLASCG